MVKANNIKNLLFGIIIVLLLLSICITVDYAANDTITGTNNRTLDMNNSSDIIVLNDTYYSEEKVGVAKLHKVVTEKPKLPLVSIVSKPSCGCRNGYYWHKRSFVDYCPHCHHYNCLVNKHKWQSRYEQELTFKYCDSDFCEK